MPVYPALITYTGVAVGDIPYTWIVSVRADIYAAAGGNAQIGTSYPGKYEIAAGAAVGDRKAPGATPCDIELVDSGRNDNDAFAGAIVQHGGEFAACGAVKVNRAAFCLCGAHI